MVSESPLLSTPATDPPVTGDQSAAPAPRSRRDLLAMAVGGAAGLVAGRFVAPERTSAAPGSPLYIGALNDGWASQTILRSTATGASFTLRTDAIATGSTGIFGHTASTQPYRTRGVYGLASGANSDGVQGVQNGPPGTGAAVRAIGGNNTGLIASTSNPSATSIYGENTAWDSGQGILGEKAGYGNGVRGHCESGSGVVGLSDNWAGVWGHSTTSWAAYLDGDVNVTGTLVKAAGSFMIDHPLDPANKYLLHSFVESPDMKNVYDGVAELDGNGETAVELPAWFEALNRDFRYQLTAVGAPAPDLHVKSGISKNRFVIAGGATGQAISWQVTGIRQDAYAKAHPIEVEVTKDDTEKGRYLHPNEHGKKESKKITLSPNGKR